MFIIVNIILCVYFFILIILFFKWCFSYSFILQHPSEKYSNICVSVLVAIRNEEQNVATLLNCLKKQSLGIENIEIILINDHSTDQTAAIAKQYSTFFRHFVFINLPDGVTGKKSALQAGWKRCKGTLTVCTDADCRMDEDWLLSLWQYYNKYNPVMIIAPVVLSGTSIWQQIQQLEFLSLSAVTATTALFGRAVMCNGANVAYDTSKVRPLTTGMNIQVASGDDMFMLQTIKQKYRQGVMYIKSRKAVVYSLANVTFGAFVSQRLRWASKNRFFNDIDIRILGMLVVLANIALLCTVVGVFWFDVSWWWLMLKAIPDFLLLLFFARFVGQTRVLVYFLPLLFVYPLYMLLIGIMSNYSSYKWKERKY